MMCFFFSPVIIFSFSRYTPNSYSSMLGYFFLRFFFGLSCTLHLRCDKKQGHPSQGICFRAIP